MLIVWFATKGSGSNEAARIETLLSGFPGKQEWPFDKQAKRESFWKLLQRIRKVRPALVVMEGTGIAGGLLCLLGRWIWGVPYVFSSGDAIAPFIRSLSPASAPLFAVYERLLCRWSAGFIGWTPYLTGRALTYGCPRAVTAAGWPIGADERVNVKEARAEWRAKWGVSDSCLVIGLVGSLVWNSHREYCYGMDLVSAAIRLSREEIVVVIVGEGDGMERLRAKAGSHLGARIRLPGPVKIEEVMPCLAAFDVAALPQSIDGVGLFRYTTKLSEYAAAKLPVITSRIPAAYDLGGNWMWRLPGRGPWEETYIDALAKVMEQLDRTQIAARRGAIPDKLAAFDCAAQVASVTAFLKDILDEI